MNIQFEGGTRFLPKHLAVFGTALGLLALSLMPALAGGNGPTSSIPSNFNGTPIPAGDSIWFNANFQASGIPSSGATIYFSSSTITSSAFTVPVPDGEIIFSPSVTCATTTFSGSTWTTTVPVSGSDEIFLSGVALRLLLSGLSGGLQPVTWNGIFSASAPGISVQWKWGAAAYTCFPVPNAAFYNSLDVKPTHQNACNYNNGDHAGTPEMGAFRACVTGGARGGGGSNFTGSWSGTVAVSLCVSQSLFTSQTPSGLPFTDGPWELGMKFQSTVPGNITAIRYWFVLGDNASPHTGHIWDSSGNLLATVTFPTATATGWQQQSLSAPLPIAANTTYTVSVNEGNDYGATDEGLSSQIINGDLSSVADGQNGVFGTVGGFPTMSFRSANYFRDVVFVPNCH